jgi:hypothetical protein
MDLVQSANCKRSSLFLIKSIKEKNLKMLALNNNNKKKCLHCETNNKAFANILKG